MIRTLTFLTSVASLPAAQAATGTPAPPVGVPDIFGLGASLAVVLAAVVLVGWLYSRTQGIRGPGSSIITILAAQPLGPKERIVLVEVGGKQIVVGMTAAQLQTLHVFEHPVVDAGEKVAVGAAFADRLKTALRGAAR